ncbi:pyridoxamine 5'-phosphate oxidase family protein [Clostridium sp. Marseille-P2415]|uniref:pyridoxamine 5'-phosphate oxidase family protein n=1 Tax=Clostridium sp. Marseille-P2415 TaxID=1805471 RepID=UPI0009885ACB|nr:pyridoxamine 5'-phosphate oxidase family protein [Clostridium sp. Marseille-P2415]
MDDFEKSMRVLKELFGRDYQFTLATSENNIPSLRVVDTYFDDGNFYMVTYGDSRKVREIESNEHVALCKNLYRFQGIAHKIGHPLRPENKEIREKLIKAFESWYFKHNDENSEKMCYVKIDLVNGFFYKDGTGYQVDFAEEKARLFPFETDIIFIE